MAEDVVQDAYARLWELLSSVEAAKARAFLFATAHHRMIDLLRREKRYADVESIEERAGTCSSRHADLQSLLDAALARLPADQRTVVLLRDLEGYAYREIAEMTGLSEVQVKVYIFRARVAMRTYIGAIDHVI
jgi:RNA polymerase sigma-70 factor (ECF subfamily)